MRPGDVKESFDVNLTALRYESVSELGGISSSLSDSSDDCLITELR